MIASGLVLWKMDIIIREYGSQKNTKNKESNSLKILNLVRYYKWGKISSIVLFWTFNYHSFYFFFIFFCLGNKYGVDNLVIIKDSKQVELSKLNPEKAYIQITYVEPYLDNYGKIDTEHSLRFL